MCDHDEEAENHRDKLIDMARQRDGAAWDAAVADPETRARMVAESEALLLSEIEKLARVKRGVDQ